MPGKPLLAKQTEPWDAEVGTRIRARRLECGLSQTELGQGVGISFQQVQKYEKGTNRVSAARLRQISGVLEVPMTFFYGPDGAARSGQGRFTPSRLFALLADRDALHLVTAFHRLPNRALKRSLVRLVQKMTRPKTVSRKKVAGGKIRVVADH
jgi:transcriptional regulator with XRE-family HTH domain